MARGRHSRGGNAGTIALIAAVVVLSSIAVFGATLWRSSSRSAEPSPHAGAAPAPVSPVVSTVPTESIETSTGSLSSTAPTTAVGVTTSAAAPPALPEFSVDRYLGKVLRKVPNSKREIALTFDDGPGPDTQKVLAILRERDVHATFFVVGRRAWKHAPALREIVAQGHEVGNHTWSHPEPGAVSEDELAEQFDRTQKLVTDITGQTPRFARPRGGKFTDVTMDNLTSRGLIMALWNIHSNDVEPSPSPEQIVKNATGGASSGAIILLHETNPNTVLALPAILDELERKGLHPVPLSQLLADDSRVRN